jgi:hypothetical protein
MKTRFFLPHLVSLCVLALIGNVNLVVAQNASTAPGTSPGTNTGTVNDAGTAPGPPATALGQRAPGQAGTALGQRAPGQAGTALGQRASPGQAGTALDQPEPALGPPAPAISQQRGSALSQRRNTATGQQGSTGIGQQGSGTAIMPPGTAIGPMPFGAGNNLNPAGNVTPGVGYQPTKPAAGTITNGFIVNNDGSKTALPGAGASTIPPGGTNTGAGGSPKNVFQTNTFQPF